LPRQTRAWKISELEDKDVYNARGEKIGEVKRVVYSLGDKNKRFVILEHGGFLGLGEKEVPLPAQRVFMRGDRLVVQGMTEAEVKAMPDWDMNSREYREFTNAETIELSLM
jgi:sporulation protein YlmC with PRC-barrel domain